MSKIQPSRGMRDFLPAEKANREYALSIIRGTFRRFGFAEIETPAIEDLERLQSGQGGDNEKMLFKILKRGLDEGGQYSFEELADLGLRYDLTLPLSRYYATNQGQLPRIFKAVQIAPVWRAERPQKGRFRQFTQCDIDIIGESTNIAEVELIVATLTALDALGINDLTVRLNDRNLLHMLLKACGIPATMWPSSLITLDKMDKIGLAGVSTELLEKVGVEPTSVRRLEDVLRAFESVSDATDFSLVADILPEDVDQGIASALSQISSAVRAALPNARVAFDITLVRGMGYYTGPIFEISHPSTTSSVAGGGRYDEMIGRFLGKSVPACGFSIGFERILGLVQEHGIADSNVALVYPDEVPMADLVALQMRLIREGQTVRLVRRTKNMAAAYSALVTEGFRSKRDVILRDDVWSVGESAALS